MATKSWKVVYSSAIGSSHEQSGVLNQDSYKIKLLEELEVLIIIVSDGAGSASLSDEGSKWVCEAFVNGIEDFLLDGHRVEDITDSVIERLIKSCRYRMDKLAQVYSVDISMLAATLVGAVVGSDCSCFFQIGDGGIVVSSPEDQGYGWVFWPQQGEYENITFFITNDNAIEKYEFDKFYGFIDEIAIFTDGLQRLCLEYKTKTVFTPFFTPIFEHVRQIPKDMLSTVNDELFLFLASERVQSRTDDDKTLVLATRRY